MMRGKIAALIWILAPLPAFACMEAPETTHQREIALLDKGIQTLKREAALIAKVKALRDQAETAFKAHQLNTAWKDRHKALLLIGYSAGHPAPAGQDAKTPPLAVSPQGASMAVSAAPAGCSGGATYWAPPADAGR